MMKVVLRVVNLCMLLIVAASVPACRKKEVVDERKPVRTFQPFAMQQSPTWEELFTGREIELETAVGEQALARIGSIVPLTEGKFLLLNSRGKSLVVHDSTGHVLKVVKSGDSTFKIHVIGSVTNADDGRLLIFDPDSNWVTVLKEPSFTFERRYQLKTHASRLIAGRDGELFTYSPEVDRGSFTKFDRNGNVVASSVAISDKELGTFHGRVQNGGIVRDENGDFYGMEPTTYDIIHFSADLKIKDVLRSAVASEWMPDAKAFPSSLKAFDMTKSHIRWWDSFRHIGRPFMITSGVMAITVYDSHGLSTSRDYLNLVRTDGRILGLGIPVPDSGRIVEASNGKVFVVRNAHLGPKDSLLPLKLYEYRLRNGALVASPKQLSSK